MLLQMHPHRWLGWNESRVQVQGQRLRKGQVQGLGLGQGQMQGLPMQRRRAPLHVPVQQPSPVPSPAGPHYSPPQHWQEQSTTTVLQLLRETLLIMLLWLLLHVARCATHG
jgi:hypothetical protein